MSADGGIDQRIVENSARKKSGENRFLPKVKPVCDQGFHRESDIVRGCRGTSGEGGWTRKIEGNRAGGL